jgi:hypothetical protein
MHTMKIKMRALALTAVAAACCCAALPARAGGPGSAGVQVLKTDLSPRAAGMGGAFVAVADDAYGPGYNPAGLGQLYMPEASAMYFSGFDDSSLQHLSFVMPLPIQGLAGLDKPGLGVSALFSDSGSFLYSPIDSAGNVNSVSMDAENTRVIALSYGEKVYSGEVNLEGYKANLEQYLGLSVKYIGSEMLETYSASAVAFDGGWLIKEPNLGLAFGASLHNFGSGVKYYQETTPLPSILRLGASYQRPTVMSQSLLLSLEGDLYLQEKLKSFRAGLEYHFQEMFNFRLGYRGGEDNSGAALGLGIHYESFALDFAMSLGGAVYNTTQVAFSYKFSAWRTAEIKKKARQYQQRPAPVKKAAPAVKQPAKPQPKKDNDFFWIY